MSSVQSSRKTTTTTYHTMPAEQSSTTYRAVNVNSPDLTAPTYRTVSIGSPELSNATYRTLSVGSPEPTTTTYRTLSVASQPEPTLISAGQMSTLPYNVNGSYDFRYLVPMQGAMQTAVQPQYVVMQQPMMQQPMMQQMVSPVYLQSLPQNVSHLSVSSTGLTHDTDIMYQQRQTLESVSGKSSVFSQSSSPIKSPAPSMEEEEEEEEDDEEAVEVEEVEIVNVIRNRPPPPIEKISRTEVRSSLQGAPPPTKLDTRYFGELLADVYRKNCDIHSCISEHVGKIKGGKMDSFESGTVEREEVEALLPKGATELTKQQMRYLLQTRLTADKSMRLLLSTFSSLREELLHMSEDLRRLEAEKETLERDLSFKADQAKQYDSLLEDIRENNRQLQSSLKEAVSSQRSLEAQLMSSKNNDSSREYTVKELDGRLRALQKENDMLRAKLAGQSSSSSSLQVKTEELSRQFNEELRSLREEKEREIEKLKTQMSRMQTRVSTTTTSSSQSSSSERSLQLKISELLATIEKRQTTITRQEEEIKRLLMERNDSSKNVTSTTITNRYRNHYPILGLLGDDYQTAPSVRADRTVVIERSGPV